MAKPDTTWKHDRALFLAERPKDVTKLPTFRAEIDGLHPYRLITVRWNRERCLHCPKLLNPGQEAALNIHTLSVLCPTCAKAHIEEILNPPKKAKPKPATKARKGKQAQQKTDEQMYLEYLESMMALHPYYDAPDRVDLDRPAGPPETA